MGMDRVTVIGGGPAGLVAAATLAEAGAAVTLLEAKAGFGGRCSSDRQEGFDLNQGPHALYVGSCAMRELSRLGVDPPRWNPVALSRSVLLRDDKAIRVTGGWGSLARLARADAPAGMTTRHWIDANVPERHRDLAAALVRVTTFVDDHDALPASVAKGQLRLGAWPGVRYLKGGWQWMVDALATQAERRGADLRTRAGVRAVERRGDGWTVHTDERDFEADAVVVAAGLPAAFAKLVDDLEPPPGPPAEVSVLDLGLRELPTRTTFALGIDRPAYYSKHSPPRHPHGVLMSAMSYAGAPVEDLERVADTVHPGWREHVGLHRHLPKMVAISAVAAPSARPAVAHAPGLFLAGDWIGAEGWLSDAAMASGAAAARAALQTRTPVTAAAA